QPAAQVDALRLETFQRSTHGIKVERPVPGRTQGASQCEPGSVVPASASGRDTARGFTGFQPALQVRPFLLQLPEQYARFIRIQWPDLGSLEFGEEPQPILATPGAAAFFHPGARLARLPPAAQVPPAPFELLHGQTDRLGVERPKLRTLQGCQQCEPV